MERKQVATAFFLLFLAAIALYFCFLIIRPFLSPIFLAVMLAIVFYPIHTRIQARIRKPNAAALLSTVLVILVFVAPAIGLGIVISRETRTLYQLLNERSTEQGGWNPYVMHAMDRVVQWAGQYVDLSNLDLRGTALRCQVERLFTGVSNSIVANVYGVLAVGAAQGALTALGFWVLGLHSPVLWGLVTALFSLVPIVGSSAVWVPAAIILAVSGHWIRALILLGWGAGVVAQSDNVIRPYVISQRANLSTLVVFFALLGGVKAFGVLGLFIGPVALSFTLVVLQMLRETILGHSAS